MQPTLNVSSHDASLALATQVFRVGFLDRADGADMGWSKVPLRQLHGANARRALEESIDRAGRLAMLFQPLRKGDLVERGIAGVHAAKGHDRS